MPEGPEQIEMREILGEILAYGGIKCKNEDPPRLHLWQSIQGKTLRQEIRTLLEFMERFGPGTFQIEIDSPEIESIEPVSFSIQTFIVEAGFTADGKWTTPRVHTEEEDIMPEHLLENGQLDIEKLERRSKKVGEKVEGAMTILATFVQMLHIIKGMAS